MLNIRRGGPKPQDKNNSIRNATMTAFGALQAPRDQRSHCEAEGRTAGNPRGSLRNGVAAGFTRVSDVRRLRRHSR